MILRQRDNFDADPCALNIYYVGNVLNATNQNVWATSKTPSVGKRYTVINDGAKDVPGDPALFQTLRDRRTVLHEVVWHLLADLGHPPFTPGEFCPDMLGISGDQLDACPVYGDVRPTGMSEQAVNSILTRLQGPCAGSP